MKKPLSSIRMINFKKLFLGPMCNLNLALRPAAGLQGLKELCATDVVLVQGFRLDVRKNLAVEMLAK